MTDDLHTRIVNAILITGRRTSYPPGRHLASVYADAIIDALGLHPVETVDRRYLRYATTWENNPEWEGQ
jgi:hypothetical protein